MAHDEGLNSAGGEVTAGLEDAARLYMEGQYQAALAAWEQVLAVDPENLRAREGIKKTQMLLAGDGPMPPGPTEPILLDIAALFEARRFDEVVAACRAGVASAGPALRPTLHELQQRAERARAVEPEIQSHIESARRLLREGNTREALPHLKQVLTLDRDHPAAARLMQAIRDRVQKRSRPGLPASGGPGSDAMPAEAQATAAPSAAPVGHGLPSSPVFAPSGEAVAEIEFEGLAMEPEIEPVADGDFATAMAGGAAELSEEPEDRGEDLSSSAFAFEEISQPGDTGGAGADYRTESPFQGNDADATVRLDRAALDAPAARPSASPSDFDASPPSIGHSAPPMPTFASAPPRPAPRASDSRRSGRSLRVIALAGVAAAALGGVVWLDPLGWLSGATDPASEATPDGSTRAVEAPRAAAPESAPPEAAAPQGAGADATTGTEARAALLLFEEGQDHFDADRLEAALIAFKEAAAKDPALSEIQTWMARTEARLEERRRAGADHELATQAFRDKEFDAALRRFYRLLEQRPEGPYARYINNAWYNWGLQLLAAGNLKEAVNRFDEAIAVRADDEEARAVRDLASSYLERPKDREFYQRLEALRYRAIED